MLDVLVHKSNMYLLNDEISKYGKKNEGFRIRDDGDSFMFMD